MAKGPILIIFPMAHKKLPLSQTSYKSLAHRDTRNKLLSKLIRHDRENVLFVLTTLIDQPWWSYLENQYLKDDLDWVRGHH